MRVCTLKQNTIRTCSTKIKLCTPHTKMLSAYTHPTKCLQLVAIFSPRPLFSTPDFCIAHLSRLEVKLDNSKTESALIAVEGMDVGLADMRSTSFGHDLKVNSHTERRCWLQAANRAVGGRDVGRRSSVAVEGRLWGWTSSVAVEGSRLRRESSPVAVEEGRSLLRVVVVLRSLMEGKVGAWTCVEGQGMVVQYRANSMPN